MPGPDVSTCQRYILWVALILVAVLSSLSSVISPLFEPPDELQHYHFVRYLVDQRELPVQELDAEISQSHQPPLYYVIGALLVAGIDDPEEIPPRNPFWGYLAGQVSRDNKQQFLNPDSQAFPYQGTALVVHSLRLWSVALALGTATVMWLLGRTLWPNEPTKVAAMLSIAVLNPMFLYIGGAVSNDNLIILCGTLSLWLSVRALKDGFAWRTTLLIGLVWGCALLSKLTGLILAVSWGVALVWTAWQRRDGRLFVSRLAAVAGIALALSGWWFMHNIQVYGEAFALQRELDVWGAREQLDLVWMWHDLVYGWTTLWGRFAYGQVPLPHLIYWLFLALPACAMGGIIKQFVRVMRRKGWAQTRWSVWLVLLTTLMTYAAAFVYYVVRSPTGANSRYIFPSLSALSALLVCGISAWFVKWRRAVLKGIVVIMLCFALFSIGLFLPWTYARPRLLTETEALAQIKIPGELVWGDGIALVGTAISPRQVYHGEEVSLTACWRADAVMTTDYIFYVHLLDHQFNSLGQRDTYTGLDTFPTSYWQPGDLFCDTYLIPISKDSSLPVVADVVIGFYDFDTRQHLLASTSDGVPLEQVGVGQVKVMPKSATPVAEQQHRTEARFEQGIVLTGYSWSATEIRHGEIVSATVAWEASGPLEQSYTIFAHLLDTNGQMVTQDDGLPRDGAYPTTFWGTGETIVDERAFTIPEGTHPGPTQLLLGFYRLEDGRRLPREAGADLPDAARLRGPIVVDR